MVWNGLRRLSALHKYHPPLFEKQTLELDFMKSFEGINRLMHNDPKMVSHILKILQWM